MRSERFYRHQKWSNPNPQIILPEKALSRRPRQCLLIRTSATREAKTMLRRGTLIARHVSCQWTAGGASRLGWAPSLHQRRRGLATTEPGPPSVESLLPGPGKEEKNVVANVQEQQQQPKDGESTPRKPRVAILWDLDNKQPYAHPADIVAGLRRLAEARGEIVAFHAAANQSTLDWVPEFVQEERQAARAQRMLEDSGELERAEPLRCPVCGNKAKTTAALKKHYKMHDRERGKILKKLAYFRAKKPSKARKMLEREGASLRGRNEAHRTIYPPAHGYGLLSDLRKAGVTVNVVRKGPDAADNALTKYWRKTRRASTIDTLFLISDDSHFVPTMRSASDRGIRTVAVGEINKGSLAREANEWVSWAELVPAAARAELLEAEAVSGDDEDE